MLISQLIFSYLKSQKQLTLWSDTYFFSRKTLFVLLIYYEQKLECPFQKALKALHFIANVV